MSRWDPTDDAGIFSWEKERPIEDALRYTALDEPLYDRPPREGRALLLDREEEAGSIPGAGAAGGMVTYEVFASRLDVEPARRAERLIAGLASLPSCALMVAAGNGSLRYFIEAPAEFARQALTALSAAYPQAEVEEARSSPWSKGEGEEMAAARLQLRPGRLAPLARVEMGPGARASLSQLSITYALSDAPPPLPVAVMGLLQPGERAVLRLDLSPAPAVIAAHLRQVILRHKMRQDYMRQARLHYQWQSPVNDAVTLVLGGLLLMGVLLGMSFYRQGEMEKLLALGAVALAGTPLALYGWGRLARDSGLTAEQAQEKMLAGALFAADLKVAAIGPAGPGARERLLALVERQADAARSVAHPGGGALVPRVLKGERAMAPSPPGRRDILGSGEAALLFHLDASLPLYRPAGARMVLPRGATAPSGCKVGMVIWQGREMPVHMPDDMLGKHQLVVAKTQRGKSSLLLHLAAYVMNKMANGERLSLLVVDPHGDLARAVTGLVPDALAERVAYLDFSHEGLKRPVGLNLLDVRLFPERDLQVERIISMFHRLYPLAWGARMEGLLRAAVACLHMANEARVRRGEDQYTILDVVPMIMNQTFRREEVLKQVPDEGLIGWWKPNFEDQPPSRRLEMAQPIVNRVTRWGVTEAAKLFVGQPSSTVDPRAVLRGGGVLVVNVPVGDLGEGSAMLIGASLLNLVAGLIEEQVRVPREERQRVVALVDESATLGAADFGRMLSELAKYGLSLVLVTQSLERLKQYDERLAPMVFANIDGLTVFTVSAQDARYLQEELGHGVKVEDLVSLPDHEAYARWWSEGETMPTFRFRLLPPPLPDEGRAEEVRRRSAERYGRPRQEVEAKVRELMAARMPAGEGPGLVLPTGVREVEDSEYEL